MPRIATRSAAPPARIEPFAPPLAHKVHITSPYVPACATNVAETIERVRTLAQAQATTRRKPRRATARALDQHDLFQPSTVVCIAAAQQRRAA